MCTDRNISTRHSRNKRALIYVLEQQDLEDVENVYDDCNDDDDDVDMPASDDLIDDDNEVVIGDHLISVNDDAAAQHVAQGIAAALFLCS